MAKVGAILDRNHLYSEADGYLFSVGARGESRTRTLLRARDFECRCSANAGADFGEFPRQGVAKFSSERIVM